MSVVADAAKHGACTASRIRLVRLLCLPLFCVPPLSVLTAQNPQFGDVELLQEIRQWAASDGIPLLQGDRKSDATSLARLAPSLSRARIVGLGESTHGTSEFYSLRHVLTQLLIERHGFRVVALEISVSALDALSAPSRFADGDSLATVLRAYGPTDPAEFALLTEWVAKYNVGRPVSEQVSVVGISPQDPIGAAHAVETYLGRHESILADSISAAVRSVAASPNDLMYQPATVRRGNLNRLAWVEQDLRRHKEKLAQATLVKDFERVSYLVRSIRQSVLKFEPFGTVEETQDSVTARGDRFMAQNVEWLAARSSGGVVVWAHNIHIASGSTRRSPLSGSSLPSMGWYLNRAKGDSYYAIAMIFGEGEFAAARPQETVRSETFHLKAPRGTVEAAFSSAGVGDCLLELATASGDYLPAWLSQKRLMVAVGGTYAPDMDEVWYTMDTVPSEHFDAIVFVENATAGRTIH